MTYCNPTDHWSACASKVKAAMQATDDPRVALEAGAEWAARYEALYRANAQAGWMPSDQARLNDGMKSLWDETVGKYLDPAGLALALSLQRFLPTLAALLEWASGPQVNFFWMLLAPSPIANNFVAARPENDEINRLVRSKLPPLTAATIQNAYPELFRQSFEKVKGGGVLP